jgi:hypothetical protein
MAVAKTKVRTFRSDVENLEVNLMHKYSDLAPWILGAIATATVAAVITVGGKSGTAARPLQTPSPAIAEILPPPFAIQKSSSPQLPAEPFPASAPPTPSAQFESQAMPQVTQPAAPAGQIWECTTNGQKTFSNNPCGAKSSLREFGPVNTMQASPVYRYSRPYPPEPAYYAPDRDDTALQEPADGPYQSSVGIPYFVHRRGERTHRPYQRKTGPAPRRN